MYHGSWRAFITLTQQNIMSVKKKKQNIKLSVKFWHDYLLEDSISMLRWKSSEPPPLNTFVWVHVHGHIKHCHLESALAERHHDNRKFAIQLQYASNDTVRLLMILILLKIKNKINIVSVIAASQRIIWPDWSCTSFSTDVLQASLTSHHCMLFFIHLFLFF